MFIKNLEKVLLEYSTAKQEIFTGHTLADFLRKKMPAELKNIIGESERYKFKGSAGQSQWTWCPWVAVLDKLITETVQSGYYPVFLFKEDMTGVYLSLNQGVEKLKEKYKNSDTNQTLRHKAEDYRMQLGSKINNFPEISLQLAQSSSAKIPTSRPYLYESGNICAKYYDAKALPSEDQLIVDINELLGLYEFLVFNNDPPTEEVDQEDEGSTNNTEDLENLRVHLRVDRNKNLSKKAKKIHGYVCQACKLNFEEVYGPIGEKFIEAHHLVPLASLKGKKVKLDPERDFAVLCSNCHSMIHRFKEPHNVEAFKKIIIKNLRN